MRHRIALALGAAVLAAATARAQPRPAFDVASLKLSPPLEGDKIYINLGTSRHGMLTLSNACLADCLRYAYSITNNEQIAGPDWVKFKDVRFDIEAKAPPGTPLPQLREMLQTLLTERFKLEYHTTQKTLSYVSLVVGKNGPKIVEAAEDTDASPKNSFIIGRIVSNRIPMATFVTLLSRFLGETVIDMTGLKGWYAVNLEWTPEPPESRGQPGGQPSAPVDAAPGPTVFTAVESLGLKLEHRKGPLDVMVIDHAERVPVGN